MKLAIVYCSQTGHTKRYAEWLADEFGITAIPLKQVDSLNISEADLVVFCTWYHAAGLTKAAWLKKQLEIHPEEKFVVLGVGATPMPCEEWPESEHEQAFCNSFPKEKYPNLVHFYAQGGFRFDKLGAFDKVAMKIYFHMMKKDKNSKDRDLVALKEMQRGFDGTKREYLEPLISYLRLRLEENKR